MVRIESLYVADECNYLTEAEQEGFLQDFFEVLNSRRVLIALIGVNLDPRAVPGFDQCVEKTIQLGPFASPEFTRKLIEEGVASRDDLGFFNTQSLTEARVARIHEASRGNPRIIQALCYRLFLDIHEKHIDMLEDGMLEATIRRYEHSRQEYEERVRRETDG